MVSNPALKSSKNPPEDFMGAVRSLRVCRSPLKWLEVWVELCLFHFIESLMNPFRLRLYEVKKAKLHPDF